ncbi:FkbM family methyltransferase [uncultured Azohydromonas sp.]|jgi:methyltransferase, FkbM family|uniref:FkbM family methyltransferase n=1 Tax=uncultured Azohydromonas sp. TaxID=487342 RepID=UPI002614D504|nr:FkbM family methyltransferase [uncultured Azohydromonas sp.]
MTAGHITEFTAYNTAIRMHLPSAADHIQSLIRTRQAFYECAMLEDVGPRLPESALVLDVGANIGNHTVFFAKVLGLKTVAVEPNPAALQLLRSNIALNGLEDRVELHPIALGATSGIGRVLDDDPLNMGRARVAVSTDAGLAGVPIRSLDEVVGERRVHLIKIDVEGMEIEVLRGARRTLAASRPMLLAEAATVENLQALDAELRPYGYRRVRCYNDTPTYLFVHGGSVFDNAVDALPAEVRQALPPTRQIVAGMATVPGSEVALRAAVSSLLPQVDRLYLYLNGYQAVPAFVRHNPKITAQLDPDGRRWGDAGKFWGLAQCSDAIYLSCDDDILYPADYVQRLVAELAQDGGRSVVGVHGVLMLQPFDGYYLPGARSVLHFEQRLMRRRRVHLLATNSLAFHTATVSIRIEDFERPNMADLWLARYLHRKDIAAVAVSRPTKWLCSLPVQRQTIYEASSSRSGTAFDTSAAQNEVARSLVPFTVRGGTAASAPLYIVEVHDGRDLDELLQALARAALDPRIVVVDATAQGRLRTQVLRPDLQCELHWLPARGDPAQRLLYRQLAADHHTAVRCMSLELHDGVSRLRDLGPHAWRQLLADC